MEKKSFWQSIQDCLSSQNIDNIILAGDLNITLSFKEKKGGSIVRDPLRETVEDIISNWDLEDVKPSRRNFTWTNSRLGPGHIVARLDRFLIHHSLRFQNPPIQYVRSEADLAESHGRRKSWPHPV